MIEEFLGITTERLWLAAGQTAFMLFWGLVLGAALGVPIGILLTVTQKGGILQNSVVYTVLNYIVNIIRSLPFIILLVAIMPFTKAVVGTRIGTTAALVPLVFYITPFLARLIESALLEVDKGIIEAAEAMGATPLQIIFRFMLPEAQSSLVLAVTTGTIGLLGATAMAGVIGGGGVGDLALTYGYQQFNTPLMVTTVIVLIIFVQLIQGIGNHLAKRVRTRQ